MDNNQNQEQFNLVIVGHVDHGKSTVIGRMLADTNSLPEGKLDQVKANCEKNSKPFEYAFLLDALKDEQSQGITIDAARVFFKSEKRHYIIIDAPGHIEFLKNMITGASRAEAAILVIDALEGVQENSRRHGYMLSMLGIKKIIVAVNKMDLVNFEESVYNSIISEYRAFLDSIGIEPFCFVPVSGITGDNIAELGKNISWYKNKTVLESIDSLEKEPVPKDLPLRFPVQDIYKFTKFGDARRIVAGTINTGHLQVGDEVVFYPSGKKSVVKTIESFNTDQKEMAVAGEATGFTLEEQIYITRGEIAVKHDQLQPRISTRFKASIFWLGKEPLAKNKEYFIKIGTAKVPVTLEEVSMVINASDLQSDNSKQQVDRHEVADCIFKCSKSVTFDLAGDIAPTSRFVIISNYEIRGGGIIREEIKDKQSWIRDIVYLRNYKWEKSKISFEERAEKYNQKSTLVLITGDKTSKKKTIAKGVEERLFRDGKVVYYLGIGSLLYGVDADIESDVAHKAEHMRRLSEVAYILLDAGIILLITAVDLTQEDLEIIKTIINPEMIKTVWVGDHVSTDIVYDIKVEDEFVHESIDKIKSLLADSGIIFKPL